MKKQLLCIAMLAAPCMSGGQASGREWLGYFETLAQS
jgi:hypothetical protein